MMFYSSFRNWPSVKQYKKKREVLLLNVGVHWDYELKNSRLGHNVDFTTLIGRLFWEGVWNLAFFHCYVFVGDIIYFCGLQRRGRCVVIIYLFFYFFIFYLYFNFFNVQNMIMFYKYIYISQLQTISYYHIVTLFESKHLCVLSAPLHTLRNTLWRGIDFEK